MCVTKAQNRPKLYCLEIGVNAATFRGTRRGVTRIEIPVHPEADPKACTEWQQIEVPTEILRLIQERNRTHFSQAHGAPFTVGRPLANEVGFKGDGPAGEAILLGTYDTTELAPKVRLCITHLEQIHAMIAEPCKPTISDDEFVGKL